MSGAPVWRSFVLRVGLRLLGATWRISETVPAECREFVEGDGRCVVAFWHGAMLPMWYRFRSSGSAALVSASRDGQLLAEYLERALAYADVVRGSSSRGGSEALAAMVATLGRRRCLVTPDGPRGPARQVKAGALVAGTRAGVPVVLAGWRCRRSLALKSWDGMRIPFPFSRIHIRYCIFEFAAADGLIDDATLARCGQVLTSLERPAGDAVDEASIAPASEPGGGL